MNLWFQDWMAPVRLVVVAVFAYTGLLLMLRVSGKRTLSKMNAFDLVVTIALGSTLATVLLSKDVALAEGLLAFLLLITLQWAVAILSLRSETWKRLLKGEPRLLALRGRLLDGALRTERVTPDEVLAAVRSAGYAALANVTAVVLETDGSFSVVAADAVKGDPAALKKVRGFEMGKQCASGVSPSEP